MELEEDGIKNKPIVFLYQNKLHLGLHQNKQIINVENGNIHSPSDVDILGLLEKQIIEVPKQTYADASILATFMSKLEHLNLRYTYLYKLLAA
ncbi:MAG: hypothetical protein GY750_15040 [Lentisphaerae bacterium]|nr:hypothetical protein [Lentisphaerota bacterium]MCP4102714.1 hypothetical protein [Lentisphaerota bacterium]